MSSDGRELTRNVKPDVLALGIGRCLAVALGGSDVFDAPARRPIPGKASGAWVFKGTRMPVALVFENLEHGLTKR
jgi:hypothetical protein